MKIQVLSDALKNSRDKMLPPGALFGMMYLIQSGHELLIDKTGLNRQQIALIVNEGIKNGDFSPADADGIIKKSDHYLFETNGNVLENAEDWNSLTRAILFPTRRGTLERNTKETKISVDVNLDGTGTSDIQTGLNFFDHMLDQIARHGLIDLRLTCRGDLEVDEHHTIEDTAIALGQVLRQAISENKAGIQRYGFILPMDEARATVAIDLSDRPFLRWDVNFEREYIGDFPAEMAEHFFYTLAMNLKATVHVEADGKNEHHILEAVFKGFAKALRFAVSRNERIKGILPTTKGII